jgi:hypothetical protein
MGVGVVRHLIRADTLGITAYQKPIGGTKVCQRATGPASRLGVNPSALDGDGRYNAPSQGSVVFSSKDRGSVERPGCASDKT